MGANMVVWIGLGAYIFFLARAQSTLAKRLRHMEMMNDG